MPTKFIIALIVIVAFILIDTILLRARVNWFVHLILVGLVVVVLYALTRG